MKQFIPMMVLVSVVACGGGNSSSGKKPVDPVVKNFEDAYRAQRQGLVIETKTIGQENIIKSEWKNGESVYSPDLKTISSSETEIVLKIEGDLIYKLEQEDDGRKTVSLYNISKMMASANNRINIIDRKDLGARMVITTLTNAETQSENENGEMVASISGGSQRSSLNFNKSNMICDSIDDVSVSGQVFKSSTLTMALAPTSTKVVTSCKFMSSEDLKKLDLSSVNFCDASQMDLNNPVSRIDCRTTNMNHILN